MANFNKCFLLGNLTRDVEVIYTAGGLAVGKFGLATNRYRKDKDDEVTFVDITAFGSTAEAIERYLGKGDPIFIEGRLNFSSWEDKNGGGKRSKLAVVVESFQFIGGSKTKSSTSESDYVDSGDVPF